MSNQQIPTEAEAEAEILFYMGYGPETSSKSSRQSNRLYRLAQRAISRISGQPFIEPVTNWLSNHHLIKRAISWLSKQPPIKAATNWVSEQPLIKAVANWLSKQSPKRIAQVISVTVTIAAPVSVGSVFIVNNTTSVFESVGWEIDEGRTSTNNAVRIGGGLDVEDDIHLLGSVIQISSSVCDEQPSAKNSGALCFDGQERIFKISQHEASYVRLTGDQGPPGATGPEGEQGSPGTQGKAGPQGIQGDPGLVEWEVKIAEGLDRAEANCSSGRVVFGGGAETVPANRLTASYPSPGLVGWVAEAPGDGRVQSKVRVYAICASIQSSLKTDRVLVVFTRGVDPQSVQASDFTVDGFMPAAVQTTPERDDYVILSVSPYTYPPVPKVGLVGNIVDEQGAKVDVRWFGPYDGNKP